MQTRRSLIGYFIVVILQLEDRQNIELETHKGKLSKEYEVLTSTFYRELEKLRRSHVQQRDKVVSSD